MEDLTTHQIDHICWLIHHSQVDHRQRAEYERDSGNEEKFQYHAGMHNGIESIRDIVEEYDVNVEARAKRYVEETDLDIQAEPSGV